jgi:hypothetical protein
LHEKKTFIHGLSLYTLVITKIKTDQMIENDFKWSMIFYILKIRGQLSHADLVSKLATFDYSLPKMN